jgi:hypothetical protein
MEWILSEEAMLIERFSLQLTELETFRTGFQELSSCIRDVSTVLSDTTTHVWLCDANISVNQSPIMST